MKFISTIIFLIFYCIPTNLCSQVIHLKEYKIYFTPNKCKDTIYEDLKENRQLKIYLHDCKGEMDVEVYFLKKIIEKGSYINSLDTLKSYATTKMLGSKEKKIVVESYFEPLRNGQWILYDSKRKKVIKKVYKQGLEISD